MALRIHFSQTMKQGVAVAAFGAALVGFSVLPSSAPTTFIPTPTPTQNTNSSFFVEDKEAGFPYTSMGPVFFLPGYNPLTGLLVDDSTMLLRRPMAIKVTNYPRSVRPQSGLSFADVVYEYYMEEGISRFIAVYYGEDAQRVGPVRSGRLFDEHIFNMYNAIFVFGFADPDVMAHYLSQTADVMSNFALEGRLDSFRDCAPALTYPLCRDRSLITYNNLFADTSLLGDAIVEHGGHNSAPDLGGMRFSYYLPDAGLPAERLFFQYSAFMYNRWEYDKDSARYMRWQEEYEFIDTSIRHYDPLVDALTGEQLAADNVVVLFVPHSFYKKTASTEIIDIDLTGSGAALVFRNGLAYPVTWIRPADGGILNLLTPTGEHFPLAPGQTWYQVLSLDSTQSQSDADWSFQFVRPTNPPSYIYPIAPTPFR